MKRCKVRGCKKPFYAREYCSAHYYSKIRRRNRGGMGFRIKITSDDELLIRKGYVKGDSALEIAEQIGMHHEAVCNYLMVIRLSKKELIRMYANLKALHIQFDKLHSHKSLKERNLNTLATRICRRIDEQEKRKLLKT